MQVESISSFPFNKYSKLSTAYYGGRLYLTFTYSGQMRTLFFNLNDVTDQGECYKMPALSNVHGDLMYLQDNYPSRLYYHDSALPAGEEGFVSVKNLDFSEFGEKQLRAIVLTGEGSGSLTVESGRGTRTVEFAFIDGAARLEISLKGKKFSLRLTLNMDTALSGVRFEYDKLGGR